MRCRNVSLLCLWASSMFASLANAQPADSPPEMREDAELAAVWFLDADRGWAVGDRGVIWHTSDGGRNCCGDSGAACASDASCCAYCLIPCAAS